MGGELESCKHAATSFLPKVPPGGNEFGIFGTKNYERSAKFHLLEEPRKTLIMPKSNLSN